jgi:hypothetical protein
MRKLLGLLTLAGVAAAVVSSLPDIKRYLKMRQM